MHVRWPINMVVSIVHRATGSGMAVVGTALLVWWLAALAAGPESYAHFTWFTSELWGGAIGYLVGIGLTLSLFQHMASGVRHFFMDAGAGYELKANRTAAWATIAVAAALTIVYWAYLLGGKA